MPIIGLLVAFVPIFEGLFSGVGLTAIFAAFTLNDWLGLAGAISGFLVAELDPQAQAQVVATLKKHPLLCQLIEDVVKLGPEKAAANAKDNAARTAFGLEDPNNPGMF